MKKTAIITGGTKGIGLATVKKFLKEDFNVVIAARTQDETTLADLSKQGEVSFVKCDVSKVSDIQTLVDYTVNKYHEINVGVNVAGILAKHESFINADLGAIKQVVDVNLMGTIYFDQRVGAQMVKQQSGVIINVGSIDGFMANFESVGYHASKGGVRMVTAAVARELAPAGVRVLSVAPAWVQTGMVDQKNIDYGSTLHMKHRILQPAEIAGAIYLATLPEASAINGTTVMADDGYTMFKGTDL